MILIVDDNEMVLEFLKDMLNLKYECASFLSARSALDDLIHNPRIYNLIITDFNMPYMNGLEFIKQVRLQANGSIPVIMVTGNPLDVPKKDVEKLRISKVIAKPFEYDYLMRVIYDLVG